MTVVPGRQHQSVNWEEKDNKEWRAVRPWDSGSRHCCMLCLTVFCMPSSQSHRLSIGSTALELYTYTQHTSTHHWHSWFNRHKTASLIQLFTRLIIICWIRIMIHFRLQKLHAPMTVHPHNFTKTHLQLSEISHSQSKVRGNLLFSRCMIRISLVS